MAGSGPGGPADDVPRLREAFMSLSALARPGADCPEAERLWAAARGELPAATRRQLVDHTSTCAACAEAWRLARELAPAPTPEQAPEPWPSRLGALFGFRPSWSLAGLAATLILAAGIAVYHSGSVIAPGQPEYRYPMTGIPSGAVGGVTDPGSMRDLSRTDIRSLLPADGPAPRQNLVLRWSPAPAGSRYHLTVTTEDLKPISEGVDLEAAAFPIPAERLAGLPAGTKLFWQVEARLPDGGRVRSGTFIVRLQ